MQFVIDPDHVFREGGHHLPPRIIRKAKGLICGGICKSRKTDAADRGQLCPAFESDRACAIEGRRRGDEELTEWQSLHEN